MRQKRIENEMSFADIVVSKAKALKVSSPKGSILIALIGTMLVFSAIGAAMLPMFSTSSYIKVYADQGRKAFLLAESGFRYAASEYLNADDNQKGATLEELNNQTNQPYTLLNNNGSFSLIVYPCYYETTAVNGTTLNTKVHGTFSSSVTGIDLSSGGWLKIGSNSSYHQYSSGSGSGSTVTFNNLTGDLSGVSPGDPVYPVGLSTSQPVTEGGDLALQPNTGSNAFPLVNGIFTIDDPNYTKTYTYATRTDDTLNGITLSNSSETWSDLTINADTNIVAKEFIKLFSTGTFGNTSRTNTYNVPIGLIGSTGPQEYEPDWDDLVDNNPLSPGRSLGDFDVVDLGDDDALDVTDTTGGEGNQPRTEAIIALNGGGSPNPFYLSWNYAGKFLNYDAQVKIGIGTWDSGQFTLKPEHYMAGLSTRISGTTAGTLESYGLSFMRTGTGVGHESDGIPGNLVPDPSLFDIPLILLWDRSGRGIGDDDYMWLAYMQLAVPAHCDGPEGDTQIECENAEGTWVPAVDNSNVLDDAKYLKDWSTIVVRMVEAASIKYSGSSDIAPGDTVTGGDASGKVIKKINDGSDEVLLLNDVDGTFSGVGTVSNGTVDVDVLEWRAKDNYIWAFYGDTGDHGTNDVAIDTIRGENLRDVDLHWPPAHIGDWSSSYDHFTLVQWNSILNTSHDSSLRRMGTGKEENAIIRTNLYTTPSDTYDYEPELGLHALGYSASDVYFDDFAYYIQIASGASSSGFINAAVLD